jgi:dihydrodipicolinate synthase/N-acetylneuraminate lyase
MTMLLDGIYIPLTMPFTHEGACYFRKLAYNIGRYSLGPAAGFVALTGEGAALSDEEVQTTLQMIADTAAPEKVLIAAIERGSLQGALAVARQAESVGFDAVLVSAPLEWRLLSGDEIMTYFLSIADSSPLPVILRSEKAGYQLTIDSVSNLAQHGNVIGISEDGLLKTRYESIVDATREYKREVTVTTVFAPVTRRMLGVVKQDDGFVNAASLASGAAVATVASSNRLRTRTRAIGFQVLAAGRTSGLVELMEAGVLGAMPALAAAAPQGVHEVYAAFKDGDPALAVVKQERLIEADAALRQLGIAGIKYGCDLNGYYGGVARLPRLPLDAASRTTVERVMAGLNH